MRICWQDAEICKTKAVQLAQSYLERHLDQINEAYEVAITTYALQLVGSTAINTAFNKLESIKYSGN